MQVPKFKVNQVVRCGLSQETGSIKAIEQSPKGYWYLVHLYNYGSMWVPEYDMTLCEKEETHARIKTVGKRILEGLCYPVCEALRS